MNKATLTAVLTVCTFLPALGDSQETQQADTLAMSFSLDEIVVTGTRTPKSLKDTPVYTRIITESEIGRCDAHDLQGLLQQELPGVEFSYAMNQQTNMNLSGFGGQSVMILVDGERLAGETMDNVDFSRLPMSEIARIEIVRGAASALYGSNAVGGVINLITKKANKPFKADIRIKAGSHNEWNAAASFATHKGAFSNVLSLDYYHIDTYNVCLNYDDDCDYRQVFGYHSYQISDRLNYKPLPQLQFTARAGYYFKQRLYNPLMPDRYRAFSGGLKGVYDMSSEDRLELGYVFDQYDKSDYNTKTGSDIRDYSNVQHSVNGCYTRTLRENDYLIIGAGIMRDWLDSYQFADAHSQLNINALAQYDLVLGETIEITGGLRWDFFEGNRINRLTPKISLRFSLGNVTFRGGYSSGFRAPTLKERYMDFNMADIFDIRGNQNLNAETSHNYNLSAEYAWMNYYVCGAFHYNSVSNRITTSAIIYDTEADGEPYVQYINIKRLKVLGAEITARGNWDCGLSADLSYCFTKEQTGNLGINPYCPARPHSANARITWHKDFWKGHFSDISLAGRFLSAVSYDTIDYADLSLTEKVTNPAYTLWSLRLSQYLCRYATVSVMIDNLFNYTPRIYKLNSPVTSGTTFKIGLNITI